MGDEKIVGSIKGNSGTNLILLSDDTRYMSYRIDNFSKEVPGERVLGSYALDDVKEYMHVYLPSTSEVTNLGSPTEARPSSSASHNPQDHGPSSTV